MTTLLQNSVSDSKTKLFMNDEKYMECWHVFHKTCMLEWLQTCHDNGWSKSCPVCRTHRENYNKQHKQKD